MFFFLLKLNLQPQVYVTSIKANAIFTKERCQDWEKRNRHNAMRFQWKVQLQEKRHQNCTYILYFHCCLFLFVFEKTEGFFQINKFSCLAMIKKKIPTHLQANWNYFWKKKDVTSSFCWLPYPIGSWDSMNEFTHSRFSMNKGRPLNMLSY